jgi:hypothetical protein
VNSSHTVAAQKGAVLFAPRQVGVGYIELSGQFTKVERMELC